MREAAVEPAGNHQARSPSIPSRAGTSIMRITVASRRTASARVMPSSVGGIGPVTPNAMNTTIMISAALVIGRPVRAIPSRTARRASPVASRRSLIAASRNSW